MAKPSPADNSATAAPRYIFNTHYLRDLSFESPQAPASLFKPRNDKPAIDLNVDLKATRLNDESYELLMIISSKAIVENKPLFLVEVQYAGIFTLPETNENDAREIMLAEAPYALFPFARRVIADITRDGGFPPLMLDGVDFRALYNARAPQAASA